MGLGLVLKKYDTETHQIPNIYSKYLFKKETKTAFNFVPENTLKKISREIHPVCILAFFCMTLKYTYFPSSYPQEYWHPMDHISPKTITANTFFFFFYIHAFALRLSTCWNRLYKICYVYTLKTAKENCFFHRWRREKMLYQYTIFFSRRVFIPRQCGNSRQSSAFCIDEFSKNESVPSTDNCSRVYSVSTDCTLTNAFRGCRAWSENISICNGMKPYLPSSRNVYLCPV